MRKDLISIICCPVHKKPLSPTVTQKDEHGDMQTGYFRCAACKFDYPVEDGIPNLLPPEFHVDQVKEKTAKPARPSAKSSDKK